MASPEPMKREKKRGEAEIYVKGSRALLILAPRYNNWKRIETRWQRSAIDGKIKGRARSYFDAVVIVSSLGGIAWVGGTQRERERERAIALPLMVMSPRCTGWRRASRRHEKRSVHASVRFHQRHRHFILSISLSSTIFSFFSLVIFSLPHLLIFTHILSLSLSL
jgi:hypothetical protein